MNITEYLILCTKPCSRHQVTRGAALPIRTLCNSLWEPFPFVSCILLTSWAVLRDPPEAVSFDWVPVPNKTGKRVEENGFRWAVGLTRQITRCHLSDNEMKWPQDQCYTTTSVRPECVIKFIKLQLGKYSGGVEQDWDSHGNPNKKLRTADIFTSGRHKWAFRNRDGWTKKNSTWPPCNNDIHSIITWSVRRVKVKWN